MATKTVCVIGLNMHADNFRGGTSILFLDVGQYSPSNPIDDKKREARSDIKEDSKLTPSTLTNCRRSRLTANLLKNNNIVSPGNG